MNIVFLLRSVVLSGGIERVMTEKANWLAHKGHQVLFLTYEQGTHYMSFPLDSCVNHEDLDCRYFTVYKNNVLIRPISKLLMKKKFKSRLKSKICSFRPNVMIVPQNIEEYFSIVTSMNVFVPIVLECHSTNLEYLKSVNIFENYYRKYFILPCVMRCSLVITLTDGDASFWRQVCEHVISVPNPLSYYPETINSVVRKTGKIICVARLHVIKRIDRLIEAFSLISNKYPEWSIDVYGDGEERERLLNLIIENNLYGKVHINAPINNIFEKYMESEFVVLSSDSESFSLVLVEAMSCGVPVVSVACPYGPSEIIEDGLTGLLTRMDVKDLADKMEWMIVHENERRIMGEQARIDAKKYKKDTVMKQWESAYKSVLGCR